jgi:hypothetical protein
MGPTIANGFSKITSAITGPAIELFLNSICGQVLMTGWRVQCNP